jgi:hypothetical protein
MTKMNLAALIAVALSTSAISQTLAVDYSITPVASGAWSYVPVPGGSEARFTDAASTIRLTVRCTKSTRRVMISPTSSVPASTMFVWTSSATRNLPARFEAQAMRVSAELAANDPLLDALTFSRGRFAVSMPGMAALVVPAWPEAARVVEDCRI